jgi:hypothetical protein
MPSYGRVRDPEEYVTWAAAISRDAEDFRLSYDERAWREHIKNKYPMSPDPEKLERQLDAVWQQGIKVIEQNFFEAGVNIAFRTDVPTPYYQYRDAATGRFISYDDAISRVMGLFF